MAGLRAGMVLTTALAVWAVSKGPLAPYRRALLDHSPPQLVLVLGGDVDRERVGARLARELALPLLVSGGSNPEYASWLVQDEGLDARYVQLDYRARDTLGNFTSLVDELQQRRFVTCCWSPARTIWPDHWRWDRWWREAAGFT